MVERAVAAAAEKAARRDATRTARKAKHDRIQAAASDWEPRPPPLPLASLQASNSPPSHLGRTLGQGSDGGAVQDAENGADGVVRDGEACRGQWSGLRGGGGAHAAILWLEFGLVLALAFDGGWTTGRDSLRALDSNWGHEALTFVTEAKFKFVDFPHIVPILAKLRA